MTLHVDRLACTAWLTVQTAMSRQCRLHMERTVTIRKAQLSITAQAAHLSYPFLLRDCTNKDAVLAKATPQVLTALRGGTPRSAKNLYMALDKVWPPLRFMFDYRHIDRWFRP